MGGKQLRSFSDAAAAADTFLTRPAVLFMGEHFLFDAAFLFP
jgi:hypothetical protein